jgi:hypothetical protein
MDDIGFFLGRYLPQIPLLAVWLVGLVFALVRRRRHSRVSLLAAVGLVIFIGRAALVPVASYVALRRASDAAELGLSQGIIGIVSALVATAGWMLILIAVFGWRRKEDGSALTAGRERK